MQNSAKTARIGFIIIGISVLFALTLSLKRISLQRIDSSAGEKKDSILQNRENNCGPIALKMILDHYHIPTTIHDIEAEVIVNDKGASMLALKKMAELKGLHAEGWRLTFDDLIKTTDPVILFIHGNHYCVVDSIRSDTLFIRDPAIGKLRLLKWKLMEEWNGEALIFRN